jgi:hypothetical protein
VIGAASGDARTGETCPGSPDEPLGQGQRPTVATRDGADRGMAFWSCRFRRRDQTVPDAAQKPWADGLRCPALRVLKVFMTISVRCGRPDCRHL